MPLLIARSLRNRQRDRLRLQVSASSSSLGSCSMPGPWFVPNFAEQAGCSAETWIRQPDVVITDSTRNLGNAPLFPTLGDVKLK